MKGHGTKFARKRDAAIAALLSHRTLEEAAHAVGVAPNTLLRWQRDPEFDAAFRKARRAAYGHTTARLSQYADQMAGFGTKWQTLPKN